MSWGIPVNQRRIGLHLVPLESVHAGPQPQTALVEHQWGLEPGQFLRTSWFPHQTPAIPTCVISFFLLLAQPVTLVMPIHLISKSKLVHNVGRMYTQTISKFMVSGRCSHSSTLTLAVSHLPIFCPTVFNYWVDNHPGGADKIQAFADVDETVYLTFPGWHDMPR